MSVVSVAIRAGIIPSRTSTPEVPLEQKTALPADFTNIAGANRASVGDKASTRRPQGRISVKRVRRVDDAQ